MANWLYKSPGYPLLEGTCSIVIAISFKASAKLVISVSKTKTSFPCKANFSATAKHKSGTINPSTIGSEAVLIKKIDRLKAPPSSNIFLKNIY